MIITHKYLQMGDFMKGIVLILFIGLMAYEALSLMQIISPTVDEAKRVSQTKSLFLREWRLNIL